MDARERVSEANSGPASDAEVAAAEVLATSEVSTSESTAAKGTAAEGTTAEGTAAKLAAAELAAAELAAAEGSASAEVETTSASEAAAELAAAKLAAAELAAAEVDATATSESALEAAAERAAAEAKAAAAGEPTLKAALEASLEPALEPTLELAALHTAEELRARRDRQGSCRSRRDQRAVPQRDRPRRRRAGGHEPPILRRPTKRLLCLRLALFRRCQCQSGTEQGCCVGELENASPRQHKQLLKKRTIPTSPFLRGSVPGTMTDLTYSFGGDVNDYAAPDGHEARAKSAKNGGREVHAGYPRKPVGLARSRRCLRRQQLRIRPPNLAWDSLDRGGEKSLREAIFSARSE